VSLGKCHVVQRTKQTDRQTERQVTYKNCFSFGSFLVQRSHKLSKQMGLLLQSGTKHETMEQERYEVAVATFCVFCGLIQCQIGNV
jgi:hypothetical protein